MFLIMNVDVVRSSVSLTPRKYDLLTKREVKMVGYWSCLFCMFMDGDVVKVHKHATQEAAGKFPARKLAPLESQSRHGIWSTLAAGLPI